MKNLQTDKLTRRDFLLKFIRATGSITLGGALLKHVSYRRNKMEKRSEYVDDKVIANLYSADYPKLIHDFVNATTPDLNRMYFCGFSSLVLASQGATQQWKYDKLQEIKRFSENISNKTKYNRHRVQTFPACVSSHIIPFCTQADHIYANDIISDALEYPQREVQEIVFQNLICSLTNDEYTWEHFYISDRMIESVQEYIEQRKINALLNTGCCLALQFLTYYETALIIRKPLNLKETTCKRQIQKINKIFDSINNSTDSFCWLQKSWLYELRKYCRSIVSTQSNSAYTLFPPQITELIMGWKFFSNPSHPWHPILISAIRFLLLSPHLNELIVNEKKSSSLIQNEYGPKEASVALKKSKEFFLHISLHQDIFKKVINNCDGPLQNTAQSFGRKFSKTIIKEELDPSWSLVPFRNYFNPVLPSENRPDNTFYQTLLAALGGGFIGSSVNDFIALLCMRYWKPITSRTPNYINQDFGKFENSIESSIQDNDNFKEDIKKVEKYMEGNSEIFLSKKCDVLNETNRRNNSNLDKTGLRDGLRDVP